MTTIHFLDGELEYSDPKTARGRLRKMGLSVRNAKKEGNDYYFDIGKPSGVSTPKVIARPVRSKPQVSELTLVPRPILQIPVERPLETPKLEATGEEIIVEGIDLKAYDKIVNFIPDVNLTIDHRGIGEIVIPAPNITRTTNRFNGFYSEESGNVSSYLIDPRKEYLIERLGL